jgi:hypothetical protein
MEAILIFLLIIIAFIGVLILAVVLYLLQENTKKGEWETYPNPQLYPEHHHTPYMGIPAEVTGSPPVAKFCESCGRPVSPKTSYLMGYSQHAFCEHCGHQLQ